MTDDTATILSARANRLLRLRKLGVNIHRSISFEQKGNDGKAKSSSIPSEKRMKLPGFSL